jgi:hypothetical protein
MSPAVAEVTGTRALTQAPTRLLNFASEDNLPLAKNAKHKFAAAHALCIYPSNAIYSFIPKNACSTMRYSIAVANGCVAPEGDFRWIHKNNQTFVADLRSLATASFTFVILRCPFERLVSAFLDKVVDMHSLAWTLTPTSEVDLTPADLSFRQFVTLLATKKIRSDAHWRPQADFLVYRDYDRYFDFRNMTEVERELEDRIGLKLFDSRDRSAHATSAFQTADGSFSDTPVRELLMMKRDGKLPTIEALFDRQLWDVVERLYRDDVHIYSELAYGTPSLRRRSTDESSSGVR